MIYIKNFYLAYKEHLCDNEKFDMNNAKCPFANSSNGVSPATSPYGTPQQSPYQSPSPSPTRESPLSDSYSFDIKQSNGRISLSNFVPLSGNINIRSTYDNSNGLSSDDGTYSPSTDKKKTNTYDYYTTSHYPK